MNKLISRLSIVGAIFVIVAGTLLHFVYGWSGDNFIVGLFAPVNESVWEHMKLAFIPLIIFGFIDYAYLGSKVKNYCFALMKEVGVAIVFIIAVFYIYTAFTGDSILWVDISSFIVGVILAKWTGYLILTDRFKKYEFRGLNTLSAIILAAIFVFFIYATLNPPHVGLFRDPVSGGFGIENNI
ncbi:hypothetical protein COT77_02035 [Candidatus Berkelbacteria bacterium CG10_big_fil_rev_8_21_14_0_10_41_12]|uniref:Uncharacterized protein n=1 Tax=Candidatus Berkelbacteria bacterium CG10_big_fil_rev_8_21_14_0_10_41_12 TaxID=1974513 RepID=A0A2M6WX11_9BACT|nr:MAG: hypothetical protein COT77_02035 [Candidatus Berkelbacteria bacterium CG10_big_fil_rev_8_21_14_0_10_41_12]